MEAEGHEVSCTNVLLKKVSRLIFLSFLDKQIYLIY